MASSRWQPGTFWLQRKVMEQRATLSALPVVAAVRAEEERVKSSSAEPVTSVAAQRLDARGSGRTLATEGTGDPTGGRSASRPPADARTHWPQVSLVHPRRHPIVRPW